MEIKNIFEGLKKMDRPQGPISDVKGIKEKEESYRIF